MANEKLSKENIKVASKEYAQLLHEIKQQIKEAQIEAIMSVNKTMTLLYWKIGKSISETQKAYNLTTSTIETLPKDLQASFPSISGFSQRNMLRMKAFYTAYPSTTSDVKEIEHLPVFSIPWGHNSMLLEKIKDPIQRLWYAQKAIKHGWSRSILEIWIKSDLFSREGSAITNFKETLPSPESDMAQQTLKDPYIFDFLTLHQDYHERDVERGLINHIQKFLLELGQGFAFIGQQVPIEVGSTTYYIDLLFYHAKLHRYVVIELKAREFDPRDAGQINFYLSAVDDILRSPEDNATIGLLLCKSKEQLKVEYALRGISSPLGVATFEAKITENLPKEFKGSLPTIEEIELELQKQEAINELENEMELNKKKKSA